MKNLIVSAICGIVITSLDCILFKLTAAEGLILLHVNIFGLMIYKPQNSQK